MTYFVYEYKTKILDENIKKEVNNVADALGFIIPIIFRPENIPLHINISSKYRNSQQCLKAIRYYDPVEESLVTKRYFASQTDANAMKLEYDVIYDSNHQSLIDRGMGDLFEFSDSITEIADIDFGQVDDNLYP